MKDINATLRRLDEEILGHKQRIAFSQVEIARLQDTRQVLMRLVEDDQRAEQQAKLERVGVLAGAHAKPELIVRMTGTGGEDGSASAAAKNGTTMHLQHEGDRKVEERRARDAERHRLKRLAKASLKGTKPKPSGDNASSQMREAVLRVVDDQTPMNSREIANHLGIRGNDQLLYNALYQLRKAGVLLRGEDSRYVRRSP
jgi:hypothetical protein